MAKEVELVFYGRLSKIGQLRQAVSVERQEQYSVSAWDNELENKLGQVRVRRSQTKSGVSYVLTTKSKLNKSEDTEHEIEVNQETFESFKSLTNRSMKKDRYFFPIEMQTLSNAFTGLSLVWEVDMYMDGQGEYHPWCKVDLEFPVNENGDVIIPETLPDLPIQFDEVLNGADEDSSVQSRIRELYDEYFLN